MRAGAVISLVSLSLLLCAQLLHVAYGSLSVETLYVVHFADCCRPALFDLMALRFARRSFVADTVHQMEATHPQAVGVMLAFTSRMVSIGPDDGIARSARSGNIRWAPRVQTAQLTEAFEIFTLGMPSAAACAIAMTDGLMSYAQPYLAELPAAVLAVVRAEPSGALGLS